MWAAIVATTCAVLAVLLPVATAQQPLVTSTATPTRLPTYSVVLASDIFVRGGPDSAYVPVGRLGSGDILDPLSRSTDGEWILIAYNRGFGWIRGDLAYWSVDIDDLPVFDETNLTPTPIPGTLQPTAFLLTETPEGNWVRSGERGAFLRAGPGIRFPILDSLTGGELVDPVAQNETGDWILLRRGDGHFAWISYLLVNWADDITALPVILDAALTPSATFTHTATFTRTLRPTRTFTPTETFTPTYTETATETATITETPTSTFTVTSTSTLTHTTTNTVTPTPSATFTNTASSTPSFTPESSVTPESSTETPTLTFTSTATNTHTPLPATLTPSQRATEAAVAVLEVTSPVASTVPSRTTTLSQTPGSTTVPQTETPTSAVSASSTPEPAAHTPVPWTPTVIATETNIATLPATHTQEFDAGATATRILLETAVANNQRTIDAATLVQPTITVSPTTVENTASATFTPTLEPSNTPVPTSVLPTIASVATGTPSVQTAQNQDDGGTQPELLVAGLLLMAVLIYVVLYIRGASRANTYASGFIIERCPVCSRGTLYAETRQDRMLGIPRIHFTVRCTECRSVLREVGANEWRYAVDPAENPELFERWNNRVVTGDQLKGMAAGRRAGLGSRSHVRPRTPPPDRPDTR